MFGSGHQPKIEKGHPGGTEFGESETISDMSWRSCYKNIVHKHENAL